jgi:hypothetical protein
MTQDTLTQLDPCEVVYFADGRLLIRERNNPDGWLVSDVGRVVED